MKKAAIPLALLLVGTALSGCPIYDHEDAGCYVNSDCAPGYLCEESSGSCVAETSDACRRPSDCGANETCSRAGTCVAGDCHFETIGCVRGYECSAPDGRWECIARSVSAGGAGGEAGAGPPPEAGAGGDGGSAGSGLGGAAGGR